jgi:ribonucleotide monophosphatase NagD (HAD superfamily)
MIGDSVDMDIIPANKAGIEKTFLIDSKNLFANLNLDL